MFSYGPTAQQSSHRSQLYYLPPRSAREAARRAARPVSWSMRACSFSCFWTVTSESTTRRLRGRRLCCTCAPSSSSHGHARRVSEWATACLAPHRHKSRPRPTTTTTTTTRTTNGSPVHHTRSGSGAFAQRGPLRNRPRRRGEARRRGATQLLGGGRACRACVCAAGASPSARAPRTATRGRERRACPLGDPQHRSPGGAHRASAREPPPRAGLLGPTGQHAPEMGRWGVHGREERTPLPTGPQAGPQRGSRGASDVRGASSAAAAPPRRRARDCAKRAQRRSTRKRRPIGPTRLAQATVPFRRSLRKRGRRRAGPGLGGSKSRFSCALWALLGRSPPG